MIVLSLACTSEDRIDYHSKTELSKIEKDSTVDIISGYTPEDLLKVFIHEVYTPVDSICNFCKEQILSEQKSDFNTEMILIEQTVNLIEYKYDKLEKFLVFEQDENAKSMMLRFLDQKVHVLQNYYSEIVRLKYATESEKNAEQKDYEIIESIKRKERELNILLDEIFKDYFEHHDKT
ncbi:MAG: hypothetical protein C0596_11930 [Marinilabiliales bacterium]|nr:MAG: hypothetical protein C0596_11930 [Marinilabiliales bacterium]